MLSFYAQHIFCQHKVHSFSQPIARRINYTADMNASIALARSLTSIVFRRMLRVATWVVIAIFAVLFTIVVVLAVRVSSWWLLTLIVLVPITFIALSIGVALWYLTRRLMPRPLLPSEHATLSHLADKILRLLEARSTPVPLIMFFIAKDVVRGKGSRYIDDLVADTTSLKHDVFSAREIFTKKDLS